LNKNKKGAIIIEGHVQGLSLTRTYGENQIPVFIVDRQNCVAKYSKYCKKFFICPDFNSDDFAEFLINLAKIENLNGWVLIPSNDHAVITISRNQAKLEKHYLFLVPKFDKIDLIYNKSKLLKFAQELNIPIPSTFCFKELNASQNVLSFPIITKGKYGLSFYKALKKKAFLSKNNQELYSHLSIIQEKYFLEDTFSQTLISSDEENKTISFTAFSINGIIKSFWIGVKLREHPVKFGTATFAISVKEPAIYNYAAKLIEFYEYTGVCEIEFLKDPLDNDYKLIEINARTWLWVGLAKECGVNYGIYVYNYLNGIPNQYPKSYRAGIKWLNPITDFVFSVKLIFMGHMSLCSYVKSLKGEIVNALYVKNDFKPFFAYLILLLSFIKKR
jgi:D-aspartate ligase